SGHRLQGFGESSVKRRAVDSCGRFFLVVDRSLDAAAPVRAQLGAFGSPAATEQVSCDPVQPRQHAGVTRTAARAALEGEGKRLRGEVVGDIRPCTPAQIPVHRNEMPLEDQLERLRLTERERRALRIGLDRFHHPACSGSPESGFAVSRTSVHTAMVSRTTIHLNITRSDYGRANRGCLSPAYEAKPREGAPISPQRLRASRSTVPPTSRAAPSARPAPIPASPSRSQWPGRE